MEYKALEQVKNIADVQPSTTRMSKRERLERWALVLERQDGRLLQSLVRTEFATKAERNGMRVDNSPLTVAFEDPVLRDEGLKSDRLGDAINFFELTDDEAHSLVCYCHYGATMAPGHVASRVRRLAAQYGERSMSSHGAICIGAAVAAMMTLTMTVF